MILAKWVLAFIGDIKLSGDDIEYWTSFVLELSVLRLTDVLTCAFVVMENHQYGFI